MRVTDRMTFEGASAAMVRNQERAARAGQEVTTGMRVQNAWDDPAAASLWVENLAEQSRLDVWKTTSQRAEDELGGADSALDAFTNVVIRARELTLQMANGVYSAGDRAAAATEMTQLRTSALALANTQVAGRYIFGGRSDGVAPFDATGAFVGDTGLRMVEVGPSTTLAANIRGDIAVSGAGGGVDILAVLETAAADLASNNVVGLRGALDTLDTGTAQVATARSQVGALMAGFSAAATVAHNQLTQTRIAASSLVESNLVDAASRLALAQRAVEASMGVAQKTFSLSLLERLR